MSIVVGIAKDSPLRVSTPLWPAGLLDHQHAGHDDSSDRHATTSHVKWHGHVR
jgi:hypothetical protein